jgi:hypothetical protein
LYDIFLFTNDPIEVMRWVINSLLIRKIYAWIKSQKNILHKSAFRFALKFFD